MKKVFLLAFIIAVYSSCQSHFITDDDYLEVVESDFNTRKDSLSNTAFFDVFESSDLSTEYREAMMFLYAYMPLGDIYDYPSSLFLKSVEATLSLKSTLPWVDEIPEDIFRHFVLPIRVNNEYIDSSRYVLFSDLYPRVKNLSMHDAALEINHWCHERVVYKPSDSRASSPLSTMVAAHGCCDEESIFTVAALRAVGIPARQVYTPRWVHTDDNHAWVEVWVDGKWSYMGACEPEPELNVAWFSKTAQRGMLMHTKVFGKYDGVEQKMLLTPNFAEINVTNNYAPTVSSIVTVVDENDKPVAGVNVSFRIYNYAQFFPVYSTTTLDDGKAEIVSGKGDLFVWASKGDKFGYKILPASAINDIRITLNRTIGDVISEDINVNPPVEGNNEVVVNAEQIAENIERLKQEDMIRENYISTFMTSESVMIMAIELGYKTNIVDDLVRKSRGNWNEMTIFLRESKGKNKKAITLLNSLLEQDLRDVKAVDLADHLNHSPYIGYSNLYNSYVLSPRISNELITSYKKSLQESFGSLRIAEFRKNPDKFVEWVNSNIRIKNDENSMNVPISPVGVFESKYSDEHSRNIFFVAACRAFGIPARLDRVTGDVQFFHRYSWRNASFDNTAKESVYKGYLRLRYDVLGEISNPLYNTHFSLSKIENGVLKLLDLSNVDGFEETTSYKKDFAGSVVLDEGYYMLTSGRRMASGKVLSVVKMFNIIRGKTTNVELVMRQDTNDISVIGNINPEISFLLNSDLEETTILSEAGRGYFVLAIIDPKKEPSNQALRDIALFNSQFNDWNRKMIMLFDNKEDFGQFDKHDFPTMPNNMVFGIDIGINKRGKIADMLCDNLNINNRNSLPIIVIADTFGRIVYFSQGYKIGQVEQLINIINKL